MDEDEITILIADDEPALREIFGGWVESMHCGKVLTAADGLDAFEILKSTNVALLITDVGMPRMDGLNLVKRLSELTKTPRVIFVSAFSDVNQREMYGRGAESILAKPLRKEDLVKTVERALTVRSELWLASPHLLTRQSIVIGDPRGHTTTGESYFALGQGGFCARYSEVIALGKVDFECHLSDGHITLRGSGIVRWRSSTEGLVGVEFDYLDASSRACVVDEIAAFSPSSYIPSNVVRI